MNQVSMTIDGNDYVNWKDVNVSFSMEDLAGTFSFTATQADTQDFQIKAQSECQILIDGEPVLTGTVEAITPQIDAENHEVLIEGRDNTADIVDSTLAADSVELTAPVSLEDVIQRTLDAIGSSVGIVNESGSNPQFEQEDIVSCKAGQGAFEFLEGYSRKKAVLLTRDGLGNIVIARAGTDSMGFTLTNREGDTQGENNVLDSSARFDYTKRFREYTVVSQANMVTANNFGSQAVSDLVSIKNSQTVIDDEMRSGRKMVIVAENASDEASCKERAEWEANIRKARSRTYNARVATLIVPDSGVPFNTNRTIQVNDDLAGISSEMLIKSVSFTQSVQNGSKTSFEIVDKDAYTLLLNQPLNQVRTNPQGALIFDTQRARQ